MISLCPRLKIGHILGEMTEWLKVLAWKVSVLVTTGTEGSNPPLSANEKSRRILASQSSSKLACDEAGRARKNALAFWRFFIWILSTGITAGNPPLSASRI